VGKRGKWLGEGLRGKNRGMRNGGWKTGVSYEQTPGSPS